MMLSRTLQKTVPRVGSKTAGSVRLRNAHGFPVAGATLQARRAYVLASAAPASVEAELVFFSPPQDGSKPWQSLNTGADGRSRNWEPEPYNVKIHDVRGNHTDFKLDAAGFQYGQYASQHKDFTDDEAVKREYYPESIDLVKRLTGATRIVPFDHTIRRRRPGEADDSPEKRQPVPQAHVDQTPDSARARVHRHVPEDAEELLRRRFQIINLWRPISHPAWDWPLALCDFRSVDVERDFASVVLKYPDGKDGVTFGVKYDPQMKWNYMRGMEPSEFVLIKCYDSKCDGKTATFTPHTAFSDPTTPKGSPLRESIELRLLVFYND